MTGPALWHETIPVARRLPLHESFKWEGITFTLTPMSGHTRFATLISFEIDGQRVVHTGDQIFYDTGPWQAGAHMTTNHVYKNGLDTGCYHAVVDDLERNPARLGAHGSYAPLSRAARVV